MWRWEASVRCPRGKGAWLSCTLVRELLVSWEGLNQNGDQQAKRAGLTKKNPPKGQQLLGSHYSLISSVGTQERSWPKATWWSCMRMSGPPLTEQTLSSGIELRNRTLLSHWLSTAGTLLSLGPAPIVMSIKLTKFNFKKHHITPCYWEQVWRTQGTLGREHLFELIMLARLFWGHASGETW